MRKNKWQSQTESVENVIVMAQEVMLRAMLNAGVADLDILVEVLAADLDATLVESVK